MRLRKLVIGLAAASILPLAGSTSALAAPANFPPSPGDFLDWSRVNCPNEAVAINSIGGRGVLVGAGAPSGWDFTATYTDSTHFHLVVENPGGSYDGDYVYFGFSEFYVKSEHLNVASDTFTTTSAAMWAQVYDMYQANQNGPVAVMVWAGEGNQLTYGPPNGLAMNTHWYLGADPGGTPGC